MEGSRGLPGLRHSLPVGSELLISDRPITDPAQDRLERDGLVTALTNTIERAPRDGLVIGLEGAWGEGKSSVLELVTRRLDARGSAQVLTFNPWSFASSDDLLSRFFSQLAAEAKLKGGASAEPLARAFTRMGATLGPMRATPAAGRFFGGAGRLARGAAAMLRAGTQLHDRRAEVLEELKRIDRPIVVIVDDLDRLQRPAEFAEMVRLIRHVADFPRVTYLLAYDRPTVARALGSGDTDIERVVNGSAYMEKIVQSVFAVPPARRDLLDRVLDEAIEEALGDYIDRMSPNRWAAVQLTGVRGLFRNLRDVRRYASALVATIALVHEELELADVLAMEAIRVLEPAAFALIAAHPHALSPGGGVALDRERSDAERRKLLQAMVDAAVRNKGTVRELLEDLFPTTAQHLSGRGGHGSSWQPQWRRDGRLAHPDLFSLYLDRGLPRGGVSSRQVSEALAALDDRGALERLLTDTSDEALIALFDRLQDYEGRFTLREPEIVVELLAKKAASYPPRKTPLVATDVPIATTGLMLRILRGWSPEEVERVVEQVLPRLSLSARGDLLRVIGSLPDRGRQLVADDAAERLETEFIDAVLGAPAATLRDERDLGHLIWRAQQKDPDRARSRLSELITDPLLLVRWLEASAVVRVNAAGTHQVLPWLSLVKAATEEHLVSAVQMLDDSWLTENASGAEREAVAQALYFIDHPDEARASYNSIFRWEESTDDEAAPGTGDLSPDPGAE